MSEYEDLPGTIDKIVDEAITSAMAFAGWFKDDADGTFWTMERHEHVSSVQVSGPRDGPVRQLKEPFGRDIVFDPEERLPEIAETYRYWDAEVRGLFADWQGLPTVETVGDGFQDIMSAVRKISLGEDLEGGGRIPANPNLSDLAEINGQLSTFAGGTVATFRGSYSQKLETAILPNQCGLASAILEGMLAEAAVFHEARKSVASTADAMLAGMKKARPAPEAEGDSTKAILTVFGVGLAIAGVFVSGGASVLVNGGRIIAPIINAFGASGPPKEVPVDGPHPGDVYSEARKALDQIDKDMESEELAAAEKFRTVSGALDDDAAAYDLAAPSDLVRSTSIEALIDRQRMLHVDSDRLRAVGGVLVPGVADEISSAAAGLDPYGARLDWYRFGALGMGSTGPSASFERACNDLALVLVNTANELRRAGRHLEVAASWFDQREREVLARFRTAAHDPALTGPDALPYDVPTPPPPHMQRPGAPEMWG